MVDASDALPRTAQEVQPDNVLPLERSAAKLAVEHVSIAQDWNGSKHLLYCENVDVSLALSFASVAKLNASGRGCCSRG